MLETIFLSRGFGDFGFRICYGGTVSLNSRLNFVCLFLNDAVDWTLFAALEPHLVVTGFIFAIFAE